MQCGVKSHFSLIWNNMADTDDKLGFSWLFTYLLLGNQCLAYTKQWLPNTNFDNPANWNKGRVPCAKDRVQFHGNKPLSVSLRSSHIISSMSLPMNGEVLFNDGAELSFNEEVSTDCKDPGDIHFVASFQNWFNPNNWLQIDVKKEPFTSSPVSILHADNVPCVHDTVVFPQDSSFMVKSVLPVRVAGVELYGEGYEDVSVATSKTEANFVQIVLTDQDGGNKAQMAAEHLKEVLILDKSFNVAGTEVLEQSGTKAAAGKKTEKQENSLIIPLAVGLSLLFMFLIVVIFLICRRTERQSHLFAMMMEDDMELVGISNSQTIDYKENRELREKQLASQKDSCEMSMENPLYESSTK